MTENGAVAEPTTPGERRGEFGAETGGGAPSPQRRARPPLILLVGEGEDAAEAIALALKKRGLGVMTSPTDRAPAAVVARAPDVVVLMGDAAAESGAHALAALGSRPTTARVPVAVVQDGGEGALERRLRAMRNGALAVIDRVASPDAMATRIGDLAWRVTEHATRGAAGVEMTVEELTDLVRRQLGQSLGDPAADGLLAAPGREMAEAVETFVSRLRGMVRRVGGASGKSVRIDPALLAAFDDGATLALRGARLLVVHDDPGRADALAQELRARGATVVVAGRSPRSLARGRELDPEVVLVDDAAVLGSGPDLVAALARDSRLRWSAVLVLRWEEIWPDDAPVPDMATLAERIAPHRAAEREVADRAIEEVRFEVDVDRIGPCRALRALALAPHVLRVSALEELERIEVDLADGLVAGARADGLEGLPALARLTALSTGVLHVERRRAPASADVLLPVDEALARATREAEGRDARGMITSGGNVYSAGHSPSVQGSSLGRTFTAPDPDAAGAAKDPIARVLGEASVRFPTQGVGPNADAVARAELEGDAPLHDLDAPFSEELTADPRDVRTVPPSDAPPSDASALPAGGVDVPPLPALAGGPEETAPLGAHRLAAPSLTDAEPEATPRPRARMPTPSLDIPEPKGDEGLAAVLEPDGASVRPPASAEPDEPTERVPRDQAAALGEGSALDARGSSPAARRGGRRAPVVSLLSGVGVLVLAAGGVALWRAPRAVPTPAHPASGSSLGRATPVAPQPDPPHAAASPPTAPQRAVPSPADSPPTAASPPHPPHEAVAPSRARGPGAVESSGSTVGGASASDAAGPGAASPGALVSSGSTVAGVSAVDAAGPGASAPSPGTHRDDADAMTSEAERLIAAGDTARAEVLLRRAMAEAPNNPHPVEALVRLYLSRRDGAAALPLAEKLVSLRRRRASYRVLLGDARRLQGDDAGAQAAYREALEIDPNDSRARSRL
jgi:DNA-binding response OmpR family regulator